MVPVYGDCFEQEETCQSYPVGTNDTARDLIQQILRRNHLNLKDPNLFYLTFRMNPPNSARKLHARNAEYKWCISTPPKNADEYQVKVKELAVTNRVVDTGFVPNVSSGSEDLHSHHSHESRGCWHFSMTKRYESVRQRNEYACYCQHHDHVDWRNQQAILNLELHGESTVLPDPPLQTSDRKLNGKHILSVIPMYRGNPKLNILTVGLAQLTRRRIQTMGLEGQYNDNQVVESNDAALNGSMNYTVQKSRLTIHMQVGGVLRIYDNCFSKPPSIRQLYISKTTSSEEVIKLVMTIVGSADDPQAYCLVEEEANDKAPGRIIRDHEYPLLVSRTSVINGVLILRRREEAVKAGKDKRKPWPKENGEDGSNPLNVIPRLFRSFRRSKTLDLPRTNTTTPTQLPQSSLRQSSPSPAHLPLSKSPHRVHYDLGVKEFTEERDRNWVNPYYRPLDRHVFSGSTPNGLGAAPQDMHHSSSNWSLAPSGVFNTSIPGRQFPTPPLQTYRISSTTRDLKSRQTTLPWAYKYQDDESGNLNPTVSTINNQPASHENIDCATLNGTNRRPPSTLVVESCSDLSTRQAANLQGRDPNISPSRFQISKQSQMHVSTTPSEQCMSELEKVWARKHIVQYKTIENPLLLNGGLSDVVRHHSQHPTSQPIQNNHSPVSTTSTRNQSSGLISAKPLFTPQTKNKRSSPITMIDMSQEKSTKQNTISKPLARPGQAGSDTIPSYDSPSKKQLYSGSCPKWLSVFDKGVIEEKQFSGNIRVHLTLEILSYLLTHPCFGSNVLVNYTADQLRNAKQLEQNRPVGSPTKTTQPVRTNLYSPHTFQGVSNLLQVSFAFDALRALIQTFEIFAEKQTLTPIAKSLPFTKRNPEENDAARAYGNATAHCRHGGANAKRTLSKGGNRNSSFPEIRWLTNQEGDPGYTISEDEYHQSLNVTAVTTENKFTVTAKLPTMGQPLNATHVKIALPTTIDVHDETVQTVPTVPSAMKPTIRRVPSQKVAMGVPRPTEDFNESNLTEDEDRTNRHEREFPNLAAPFPSLFDVLHHCKVTRVVLDPNIPSTHKQLGLKLFLTKFPMDDIQRANNLQQLKNNEIKQYSNSFVNCNRNSSLAGGPRGPKPAIYPREGGVFKPLDYKPNEEGPEVVTIADLVPNTPASIEGGLSVGMILLEINGEPLSKPKLSPDLQVSSKNPLELAEYHLQTAYRAAKRGRAPMVRITAARYHNKFGVENKARRWERSGEGFRNSSPCSVTTQGENDSEKKLPNSILTSYLNGTTSYTKTGFIYLGNPDQESKRRPMSSRFTTDYETFSDVTEASARTRTDTEGLKDKLMWFPSAKNGGPVASTVRGGEYDSTASSFA
ncbi:hypothetical protein CLF_109902 [Clonorchis sinensis]|uniref:Uncharacterized protein n=1 Tax=Clonorchis sinensis TaxID=79923 RepID=H2KUR0_CLOSI|nr:hypothetical protein CLF_109902 [Clonorchis sinensis]